MDGWCFAIVNNKLAEIFFEKKRGQTHIYGHCYIKPEEYKTKREQMWIKADTSMYQFLFQKGKYKDLNKEVLQNIISKKTP